MDWWACKGVAGVKIRIEGEGGGEVWFLGTHMQAGASKGAQAARKRQAEQVAGCVKRLREREREREGVGVRVVVAGDLNMGPPMVEGWSVHYVDEEDARAREGSYGCLVQGAGVEEVDAEEGCECEYRGDICRVLTKGVKGRVRYEELVGKEGRRLSDTRAVCFTGWIDSGGQKDGG